MLLIDIYICEMPQRITLIVSRLDGKYETYFQIVLETRFGKFQLLSENYFQEIDAQSCFLGTDY